MGPPSPEAVAEKGAWDLTQGAPSQGTCNLLMSMLLMLVRVVTRHCGCPERGGCGEPLDPARETPTACVCASPDGPEVISPGLVAVVVAWLLGRFPPQAVGFAICDVRAA